MTDVNIYKIKSATRDLVKLVGGGRRASAIAMVGESTLSRWQSPAHPEVISIAAVIALESDTGLPLVTEVLAGIHGRALSDASAQHDPDVMSQHAEFAEQAMEAMSASSRAIADLKITPAEAATVVQELRDLIAVANRKISSLSSIAASGEAWKVEVR